MTFPILRFFTHIYTLDKVGNDGIHEAYKFHKSSNNLKRNAYEIVGVPFHIFNTKESIPSA